MSSVVELPEKALASREVIAALETALTDLPYGEVRDGLQRIDFPNEHAFVPGVYCRMMFLPANTINTSKIHKVENFFFLASGHLLVRDSHGEVHQVIGPHLGITKPGTKRAVLALKDSVLLTFHPNPDDCRDIAELERRFATDCYEEVPT